MLGYDNRLSNGATFLGTMWEHRIIERVADSETGIRLWSLFERRKGIVKGNDTDLSTYNS